MDLHLISCLLSLDDTGVGWGAVAEFLGKFTQSHGIIQLQLGGGGGGGGLLDLCYSCFTFSFDRTRYGGSAADLVCRLGQEWTGSAWAYYTHIVHTHDYTPMNNYAVL